MFEHFFSKQLRMEFEVLPGFENPVKIRTDLLDAPVLG